MWRQDPQRDAEHDSAVRTPEPPPPAPAVMPGTLDWASAVGNQAVARMAADHAAETEEEAAEAEPVEAPEEDVEEDALQEE
jgi:hypothetical protein